MVAVLEPKEVLEVEETPKALPDLRERWCYRMPCAGVTYYAFAPERKPQQKPPRTPRLKLLDERVMVI